MTSVQPDARPHYSYPRLAHHSDSPVDAGWPTAFRALLLLTEAVHPGDAALARLTDDEIRLLRASLTRLGGNEHTSAA